MVRRHPAPWMNATDDRILEYLDAEGPSSPKQIADDEYIHFHRVTANRRLKKLTESGLTDLHGNGIYSITELGRKYLDGEADLSHNSEPSSGNSNSSAVTG